MPNPLGSLTTPNVDDFEKVRGNSEAEPVGDLGSRNGYIIRSKEKASESFHSIEQEITLKTKQREINLNQFIVTLKHFVGIENRLKEDLDILTIRLRKNTIDQLNTGNNGCYKTFEKRAER